MQLPKLPHAALTGALGTFIAIVVLLDGYAFNKIVAERNLLTQVPDQSEDFSISAAAGGVSTRTLLAATTTEKSGRKGVGALIKDWLEKKKAPAVTVPPPVIPPVLQPADPETPLDPDPTPEPEEEDEPEDELAEEDEDVWDDSYDFEEEFEWQTEEESVYDYPAEVPEYVVDPGLESDIFTDDTATFAPEATPITPKPVAKPVAKKAVVPQVQGLMADLYVGQITPLVVTSFSNMPAGEPFGINTWINNSGSKEAAAFYIRVRVDQSADGSWDEELNIAPQGALQFGNSQRVIASDVIAQTVPGRHILDVCVDSTGAVTESNERNNCRRVEFTVAPSPQVEAVKPTPLQSVYQSFINFLSGV